MITFLPSFGKQTPPPQAAHSKTGRHYCPEDTQGLDPRDYGQQVAVGAIRTVEEIARYGRAHLLKLDADISSGVTLEDRLAKGGSPDVVCFEVQALGIALKALLHKDPTEGVINGIIRSVTALALRPLDDYTCT